ncbi:MAG: right-handed parallel beta-helix repeat-containing protein [Planctomycetes bacterium]|nr:right-handed parallel beta-helix repeat-containing protein [Planctomycetota bacterium]
MAGAILEDVFPDSKPLVDTNWAKSEFAVISRDTPSEELFDVEASYDDGDERDEDMLCDLGEDEDLGDVVVELSAGIYLMENAVLLKGAKTFTIKGAGPNKTRLVLDTESRNALKIVGAERVHIEGLTLAPYSSDGVTIYDCPDVTVTNVAFAGALFGLRLKDSVAVVTSSVFAGCQSGIYAKSSAVEVREVCFTNCINAMRNLRGSFKVKDSYVYDNRNVIVGAVDRRTHLLGNLIFGTKQLLGWEGRPGLAANNLVHFRFLGNELGEETNRELERIDDFPDALLLPPGLNVVAVELAQLRGDRRGESDPDGQMRDHRLDRADRMALACQEALRQKNVKRAKRLAKLSIQYLGEIPLEDASDAVIAVSGLGKP